LEHGILALVFFLGLVAVLALGLLFQDTGDVQEFIGPKGFLLMDLVHNLQLRPAVVGRVPHDHFHLPFLVQQGDQVHVPEEVVELGLSRLVVHFQVALPIILAVALPKEQLRNRRDHNLRQKAEVLHWT